MKKIRVVAVGCGDRTCVYANEGVHQLGLMEIVAAVDPNEERLRYMREHFSVPIENCYKNIQEVLSQGKIADCVINGTMDWLHLETAVPFLEQGYDMLLEKPLVNNEKDLALLLETAERNKTRLMTCHVLRYSPFYKKIKELLLQGAIGEIVNVQTSERVGAGHASMSFLRGKWKNEKDCGSSLLLQKCCHDIDLLCWFNNGAYPVEVSSFGGRNYFIESKAPDGAGTRCLVDCPESVRKSCIYDVQSMYLDNCRLPWLPWQCTGKNYEDLSEEEKILSLKIDNPHGQCVYKTDGDLVDHQNVCVKFSNGSTATHSVMLGVMKPGRNIWIMGTKGEIEGFAEEGIFKLHTYDKKTSLFKTQIFSFLDVNGETGGHFGGDKGLIKDFCDIVLGKEPSLSYTSIQDSITGHLLVYAADRALKENKIIKLEKR